MILKIQPYPAQRQSIPCDYYGPISYQTGGDLVNATDIGWNYFINLKLNALSNSGTYEVYILYPSAWATAPNTSVTIVWYNFSTGIQVAPGTNLSGESVRLEIDGA